MVPGPKRIGPLQYLRALTDPRGILQQMVAEYGDPFVVQSPEGPYVFTGDPDGVRAIFTADTDTFAIPFRERLGPFFGDTSLILTSGARHKKDRKLLSPPFHGERMRAYGQAMVEIARDVSSKWKPGEGFKMLDATHAISLEVILRVVFGVEDGERRAQFREAVIRLMAATASPIIVMFEFTRRELGGIGPWARFRRASQTLDALLYEEIETRRASAESREDILSLMMSARYDDGSVMSDKELRDQLHLLLFAGHDTTAIALAWAFYWLQRQPEERERALAEIEPLGPDPEPEAIASLSYLDAICKETLRIHPVAAEAGRLLVKPLDILGYTVPPGSMVSASVLLLHDREDLYPDPRRFRPERFLERKFSPFEHIPFGGGARRCLGAAFAMYEMKIVLATLLRETKLHLVKDQPVRCVRRGLTMGPKGGIPMMLEG
jgi:cytochrome P450